MSYIPVYCVHDYIEFVLVVGDFHLNQQLITLNCFLNRFYSAISCSNCCLSFYGKNGKTAASKTKSYCRLTNT